MVAEERGQVALRRWSWIRSRSPNRLQELRLQRISRKARDQRKIGTGSRGILPWERRPCGTADTVVHFDRCWRLLPLQKPPWRTVPILLWPFHSRANGELRLRWHVLDMGQRRQEAGSSQPLDEQRQQPER